MKKIFTLIVVIATTVSAMAQGHGEMKFAGKANTSIAMFGYSEDIASDTVVVSDGNTAITLPALTGKGMTIPSMKIGNLTYTMTGNYIAGNMAFVWEKADTTFTVGEKTVKLTDFKATYEHSKNKLTVSANIKYGVMPAVLAYTMEGYYLKSVAGETKISIGGTYDYTASPTYIVRKYIEDDVEKVDVEIPTYPISATAMGDLSIGTYTVKGLTYDEEQGGFYRDYANDGLTMHFTSTYGMDGDYPLAKEGGENILVQYSGTNIAYICNNFQPGVMPFTITTTYGEKTTGIQAVRSAESVAVNSPAYNLAGQRVNASNKGIVVINGRKYLNK